MSSAAAGSASIDVLRAALQSFLSSSSSLRVLRTVPAARKPATLRPSQLLILDSSFNPPTRAHLSILSSAINSLPVDHPKRLVLLLATQNADKPTKPASFERRMKMMESLAEDLLENLEADRPAEDIHVDIGVTKLPFFVDKAAALESADHYPLGSSSKDKQVEQTHLIGYDTLIRIFNPKYYPPEHNLRPLGELFKSHRLRVTCRTDSGWGDVEEQTNYLEAIRSGQRISEGAQPEWADRIDLVPNGDVEDNAVSSTKAREAAIRGDKAEVQRLCTPRVAMQVLEEQLYASHD